MFYCGEYSPKRPKLVGPSHVHPDLIPDGQRPHYHAIIFGHSFPDAELWSVRDDIRIYTSDYLADLWGKGFVTIGDVTFESAAYVARYSLKKINGKKRDQVDQNGLRPYDRVCPYTGEIKEVAAEFAYMSNGIGSQFYERYRSDMYPHDHVVINGFERRPPRYYDEKYDSEFPESMEQIKEKRVDRMSDHAHDNTRSRLAAREKVKQAQLAMLKREEIL